MEILKEIKNRSTVKSFSSSSIDKERMNRILEAGRWAPSAKNRQPWRFIVIQNLEKKEKIKDACYGDVRLSDCGAVVALCSTNIDYKMPNGQLSYPIDIAFAASFMLLQAEHEGLGSALLTTFREQDIADMLSVPYGMRIVLLLLLGEKKTQNTAYRFSKDRIISYDHW